MGLIPTYAGNTPNHTAVFLCAWAHPHVCGEHVVQVASATIFPGSSPRMRGTRRRTGGYRTDTGLIPTYAGNTRYRRLGRWLPRAHPHVCGEHSVDINIPALSNGLIPTYAGNTVL